MDFAALAAPQVPFWSPLLLHDFGQVLLLRAEYSEAFEAFDRASRMQHQSLQDFALAASEAESLNIARWGQPSLGPLLSVWPHTDIPVAEVYDQVWTHRASMQHLIAGRQQAVLRSKDPDVRRAAISPEGKVKDSSW